ncbi:hypothetical protein CANARDRAFT_197464 [[Candida] arabinofermentans NRRL YB-2248]|uniref:TauD/TfdA-like domain-containing protein n=1 Tax=[Candida] arabinofermentans NRRL YB-2248 TaxID=983967 RepID=A0A1E4T224_9ASCO|nr:hypothetical protein CANARDRAFT_197464 [[Candida] arabinofermentans NRRL YB-2248]
MSQSQTATLKLKTIPTSSEIEQIIRKSATLSIGNDGNKETTPYGPDPEGLDILPEYSRQRLIASGIDISKGYPERPDQSQIPIFKDEVFQIRDDVYPYVERGKNADPEKKALFGAATEVINLTERVGTEIVGLQLEDLTDQQKDELALLIAERVVVFFRDQKLSHQAQYKLGEYYGRVEKHAQTIQVPGLPGATVIWLDYRKKNGMPLTFHNANWGNWDVLRYGAAGNQVWHTDLVHEKQPAGYTHLHLDTIPDVGGDTIWSSGYGAYDKLSDELKKFLDGKQAIFTSAHRYLDRENPLNGPSPIERTHPLVRTHPATGWKSLYVNRGMTKRIIGLNPVESDLILNYLFDVYEKNADIQVRFQWKTKPGYGTSAIWDNRISQHRNVFDHEGTKERHGTRVTALAEIPFFDPKSVSQREALGLSVE